jgi:hypothetical protein
MTDIIERSKQHFLETYENSDPNVRLYDELPLHVGVLEKWAKHFLSKRSDVNKEVLLSSVWLHDIGQLVGEKEEDHAVRSEREVLEFLPKIGIDEKTTEKIAHCVRSHRCKDVQPESKEAKYLAALDSVSHLTDIVYINMLETNPKEIVLAKLDRDSRDIELLPELKEEMMPLLESWRNLIEHYPDWYAKNQDK